MHLHKKHPPPPEDSSMAEGFWLRNLEINYKLTKKKVPVSSALVTTIYKYFDHQKLQRPSPTEITSVLNSPYTQGDLVKTFHLLRYYQVSKQGLFITNENTDKFGCTIKYVGAENWENVMCYMDALLFAMFANLDSFEPVLFLSNQFDNFLVNRLSHLLRVYVNMLRSGNLIKADLTVQICETLYKLGFVEALSHRQQDAATLFEFLTETLAMPLLTFKIDIQHGGKFNKDDDKKYSKERMLFVSLPEDDSDTEDDSNDDILLEECLEHYFNNSISVKRELERRATLESTRNGKPFVEMVENIDEDAELTNTSPTKTVLEPTVRTRSSTLSIWTSGSTEPRRHSKLNSKEVSLPAWMFLRLLPFYTDDNNVAVHDGNVESVADSSTEFAKRRPVLPICLKRYSFENQRANRSHRKVIIPPIINLPGFVADDADDNKASESYKLILESAICHRGTSISSGHFVAAVRKNCHKLAETDDEAYNAPWHLYDDTHKPKVVEKSFKEIFNTEWPYMLFYRLVSYEESGSSANSYYSNSVTSSPKVIVPQGSKSKYWDEAPLSPIVSGSNSPSLRAGTVNSGTVNSGTVNSGTVNSGSLNTLRQTLTNSTIISNPLPDTSPLDSKFVDIRSRYYWYIPDENKNYYKEDSSKPSTRKPSLTAPFRKNSQWSDHKHDLPFEKEDDKSSPSIWKFKKSKSPASETNDLEQTISHISLNDSSERTIDEIKEKPHHHRLHNHNHEEIHKSYKKSRKKSEAYRKEKCVIV